MKRFLWVLLALLVTLPLVSADEILWYQNGLSSTTAFGGFGGQSGAITGVLAYNFTPDASLTNLSIITARFRYNSGTACTVRVGVMGDNAGTPNNVYWGYNIISPNVTNSSFRSYNVTIPGGLANLTPGTKYWAVIDADASPTCAAAAIYVSAATDPDAGQNIKYRRDAGWSTVNDVEGAFAIFNNNGSGPSPPVANNTLTIRAVNNLTGGLLSGFCAQLNSSLSRCNNTGTTVKFFANYSKIYNILVYNVSGGTYFNYTIGNVNFTTGSDLTVNSHHYQGIVRLNATRLFLNTSINVFNATLRNQFNSTTTSILRLKALNGSNNIQVRVKGNYTQNYTCTIPTPLSTVNCQASGFYDNKFTIGANFQGSGLTDFSVEAINTSLGLSTTRSTTTGNVTWNLLRGYKYTFLLDPTNHTLANATLPANASTNLYNFTVYRAQTLILTLRDEISRELINQTFEFELISNIFAQNYTVSNGSLFLELLAPEFYTIRYRNPNYPERDYYLNLTEQSYNNITLYALNFTEGDDVLVTVKDTGGVAVEGAIVSLLRYYVYCNCYEVVEMSQTSFSGQGVFNGQYYEGHYKWSVSYLNTVYFLSTTPENLVPGEGETIVTRTFTISIGEDFYGGYTGITGVGATCSFNSQTGGLSFTWSDPTSQVTRGCLNAEYVSGTSFVNVGPSCLSASSGSVLITLNDTNTTNYKYSGVVTIDGEEYTLPGCNGWLGTEPGFDFGPLGTFLSIALYITLVVVFSFSATLVLIISAIGVLIFSIIGLMPFTANFILGLIVLAVGLGVYVMRK